METSIRRFDIDWLRVIAIGLLIIYHIAIVFQPWGLFIRFIQSSESMEWLWIPMSGLNIWRIPLLFFVSGMGVNFALKKRSWKQLITERSRRILLPYVFGFFAIVPLHVFIFQNYYNQSFFYVPNPGHLWFLGNIFLYVLVLSPLFLYMKRKPDSKFNREVRSLFSSPIGLLIILILFIMEAVILEPSPFEMYAMTSHGFVLGFLAFLFGFVLVYSGKSAWEMLNRWKWITLGIAVAMYFFRLFTEDLNKPLVLLSMESNFWVFAIFGIGYRYLNRDSKILRYLSEAAYPVYIIHMIFLYASSYVVLGWNIPVFAKFLIVVLFTTAGCYGFYEFVIRRIKILRPLFGLKINSVTKSKLNNQTGYPLTKSVQAE